MPLYVHFGAGNIGRALAGPVFSRAGYDVLFVDACRPVVEALHERGGYRIIVKDDLPPDQPAEITLCGVDAIAVDDRDALKQAVVKADLIGTAVGAAHIEGVLKSMLPGLEARQGKPVSLLFCENFNGVAQFARNYLRRAMPQDFPVNESFGFVETSIGKMVPIMPEEVRRRDPLVVWAEAYNKIIADRSGFVGCVPEGIEGLDLKECFQAYVERKLFIHNLGHAVCACWGFLKGHTLISEAVRDADILTAVRGVMLECASALIKRWPSEFSEENQRAHVEDLIGRFGNRALGDTVYRVGRDLARKLAPGDRFIGALRLVQESGGDCRPICSAIAAALQFRAADESGALFPADRDFLRSLEQDGAESVLRSHCGLSPAECRRVLDSRRCGSH
jgi:mannitol-1-phosphate 5-dehydrogenase